MPSPEAPLQDPPLPNDGFVGGGDMTLQSLDGVNFSVYSTLLSLASPVFGDMMSVGTRTGGDIVVVGETSQMVALMLRHIYPMPPPTISSFEVLDQALHVADKYQLEGMKALLRKEMMSSNSPISIASNPFRALAITANHGLQEETTSAILFVTKSRQLHRRNGLFQLARAIPSASPYVQLLGSLSIRTRVLAEVLFGFHQPPMQFDDPGLAVLLCGPCERAYLQSGLHIAPEWQARWAYAVFAELVPRPVEDWEPFFDYKFFYAAIHRGGSFPIMVPRYGQDGKCECKCPGLIESYSDSFEDWAYGVWQGLQERLESEGVNSSGWVRLDKW